MYLLYLAAGLVLLYFGADYLIKGSSGIAVRFGVKKIVIGLTIVALGTSMPEFVISLISAIKKIDNISTGNIIGSNISNIFLALGFAAIIHPITPLKRVFKLDMPVLIFISGLFVLMCLDGKLTRIDGIILFTFFSIYMGYNIYNARTINFVNDSKLKKIESGHLIKNSVMTVLGIFMLIFGGNFTVKGAVEIANIFHISELVIGMTIVALGSSLPEIFTSVLAMIKKEDDISIGNIIGSNLFNTAFVLGVIPTINPLQVDERIIKTDSLIMLGCTFLLAVFLFWGKRLTRTKGIVFVLLYFLFILNLIYNFI